MYAGPYIVKNRSVMHIVFLYELIPVCGSMLIPTSRITPFKKIIFVTAIIIQCIKMRPRLFILYG